jgi:hypothetical protein
MRVIDNPARHAAAAMNGGIAAARGTLVARVDGHAIVPPDFLSRCVEVLGRRPEVDCVSGSLATVGRGRMGEAIAAAMSSPAGVGPARFRTGARQECAVDTVAFPVYRRSALTRVGAFDETLIRNQDDELSLRLRRSGGTILLLPALRIVYFCRSALAGLWRQYFEYGFWRVRVMQKHAAVASWRQLVPGALVAAAVLLVPGALLVPALRLPAAVVLGGYALAVTAASALIARRAGVRLLPRIAAALATLHFAYGAGFWAGVVAAVRMRGGFRDARAPHPSAERA